MTSKDEFRVETLIKVEPFNEKEVIKNMFPNYEVEVTFEKKFRENCPRIVDTDQLDFVPNKKERVNYKTRVKRWGTNSKVGRVGDETLEWDAIEIKEDDIKKEIEEMSDSNDDGFSTSGSSSYSYPASDYKNPRDKVLSPLKSNNETGNKKIGKKSACCKVCGKVFKSGRNLTLHKKVHSGEKPHCCLECGKKFLRKSSLRVHERIHSGERPFSCAQCGQLFTLKSNMKVHERVHNRGITFPCGECGKEFVRQSDLDFHAKSHTAEGAHKCDKCGKAYTSQRCFKQHYKRYHSEVNSNGDLHKSTSHTKVNSNGDLHKSMSHTEDNSNGDLHKSMSHSEVKSNGDLHKSTSHTEVNSNSDLHKSMSHSEVNSNGDLHKSMSYSKYPVKEHSKEKVSDIKEGEINACLDNSTIIEEKQLKEMSGIYENQDNIHKLLKKGYDIHENVQSDGGLYKCEYCGLVFIHEHNLNSHKRIHSMKQTFECKHCGKIFERKRCFREHEMSHENVKPFACAECGKSFVAERYLKQHLKIHKGFQYPCEECQKTFSTYKYLTQHMKSHGKKLPRSFVGLGNVIQMNNSLKK